MSWRWLMSSSQGKAKPGTRTGCSASSVAATAAIIFSPPSSSGSPVGVVLGVVRVSEIDSRHALQPCTQLDKNPLTWVGGRELGDEADEDAEVGPAVELVALLGRVARQHARHHVQRLHQQRQPAAVRCVQTVVSR